MGLVLETQSSNQTDSRLRDIIAVLDDVPLFEPALRNLLVWMSEYYVAPLGEVISTALPGALRIETERFVRPADKLPADARLRDIDRQILEQIGNAETSVDTLKRLIGGDVDNAVRRLRKRGALSLTERLKREVAPTRWVRFYRATDAADDDDPRLARRPALRRLYEYLHNHPVREASAAELRASFPGATKKLRALADMDLVRHRDEEAYRTVLSEQRPVDRAVRLSAAQQETVDQVSTELTGFHPFLLRGVTGSGKTEVYLRLIAAVLEEQRTALILVPEISLTHQVVERVRARFGEEIAVLHSGLTDAERWDEFRRIARGEARIAIGARSAVFAPLPRLGIIIVDEEHDGAYKQSDGVRYHGRDVAVMRAKLEACPLVLGSATPSMESYNNANSARYGLLTLPERVAGKPLPEVDIVDLRGRRMPSPLTGELAAAIEANLASGGQTLLFLNRRGYANFLQCGACGEPVSCPNCSVTMTWHERPSYLQCHYCAHTLRRPAQCASCEEPALDRWGWGTERLEAFVRESFPGARVARLDRDTTRRKGSMESILRNWQQGAIDVLIGTQMVTKGHDVAGVTLVGVVLADLSLNIPDFRGGERTFQLLAQVAGRAGRGERRGRVLIQTLQPEHYALQTAARHDFPAFAELETATRRELDYPPFGRLVLLRAESEDAEVLESVMRKLGETLRRCAPQSVTVLGPATAPLERLRGRHRRQILLRGRSAAAMRQIVAAAVDQHRARRDKNTRLIVDIDPQNLL
jgi:primosomal protein N' (replication factor Y)